VEGIPVIVIIDRNSKVVYNDAGYIPMGELKKLLDPLLKPKP
jgi:hypothetical protein